MLDVGCAAGIDQDTAILLRPPLDLDRPAEQHAADLRHTQIVARELQTAVNLLDRRQGRVDRHFVVLERIGPLDLRFAELLLIERDEQIQVEVPVAAGAHVFGKTVDTLGDRTLLDELEELGRRPFSAPFDPERRDRLVEVGNFGARVAELRAKQSPALRLDDHAVAFKAQIAVDAVNARPALAVVEHDVARLDGHEKLALLLVEEREIIEIATQRQFGVVRRSGQQRVAQPLASPLAHLMRHVAPDGAGVGARQGGFQVDHAGTVARVAILAPGRPGRLRAGELGAQQLDVERASCVAFFRTFVDFPADIGV